MKAKNAVYAAVGAPIVAARALNARLGSLREELESRREGLGDRAQKALEEWTREGREAMERVSDGNVVDEFAARVDFDQARDQVGRLRDQLEEMLATWRSSFRPEGQTEIPEAPEQADTNGRTEAEKVDPGREEKTAVPEAQTQKGRTGQGTAKTSDQAGSDKSPAKSPGASRSKPTTKKTGANGEADKAS